MAYDPAKLAAKKDRRVARSSHGEYRTVADLVAHQKAIEAKSPARRKAKREKVIIPVDPMTGRKDAWGMRWEAE